MEKSLALIALASLLALPELAVAIGPNAGPNTYGIYFEVDGEFINLIYDVQPNSFIPTYVILAGVTRSSVGGWEVAFDFTAGTGAVIATEYLGQAVNLSTAPTFIVEMDAPIACVTECYLVLAEMTTLFFAGYQDWYGGPTEPASIEGIPSFVNGEDPTEILPCFFSTDHKRMYTDDTGWMTIPLASVNPPGPWPIEHTSWSGLKRMYR